MSIFILPTGASLPYPRAPVPPVPRPLSHIPLKLIKKMELLNKKSLSEKLIEKVIEFDPAFAHIFEQAPQIMDIFDQSLTKEQKNSILTRTFNQISIPMRYENILRSLVTDVDQSDFTLQSPEKLNFAKLDDFTKLIGFDIYEFVRDYKSSGYTLKQIFNLPLMKRALKILIQDQNYDKDSVLDAIDAIFQNPRGSVKGLMSEAIEDTETTVVQSESQGLRIEDVTEGTPPPDVSHISGTESTPTPEPSRIPEPLGEEGEISKLFEEFVEAKTPGKPSADPFQSLDPFQSMLGTPEGFSSPQTSQKRVEADAKPPETDEKEPLEKSPEHASTGEIHVEASGATHNIESRIQDTMENIRDNVNDRDILQDEIELLTEQMQFVPEEHKKIAQTNITGALYMMTSNPHVLEANKEIIEEAINAIWENRRFDEDKIKGKSKEEKEKREVIEQLGATEGEKFISRFEKLKPKLEKLRDYEEKIKTINENIESGEKLLKVLKSTNFSTDKSRKAAKTSIQKTEERISSLRSEKEDLEQTVKELESLSRDYELLKSRKDSEKERARQQMKISKEKEEQQRIAKEKEMERIRKELEESKKEPTKEEKLKGIQASEKPAKKLVLAQSLDSVLGKIKNQEIVSTRPTKDAKKIADNIIASKGITNSKTKEIIKELAKIEEVKKKTAFANILRSKAIQDLPQSDRDAIREAYNA